jgi:hypothetical protein
LLEIDASPKTKKSTNTVKAQLFPAPEDSSDDDVAYSLPRKRQHTLKNKKPLPSCISIFERFISNEDANQTCFEKIGIESFKRWKLQMMEASEDGNLQKHA